MYSYILHNSFKCTKRYSNYTITNVVQFIRLFFYFCITQCHASLTQVQMDRILDFLLLLFAYAKSTEKKPEDEYLQIAFWVCTGAAMQLSLRCSLLLFFHLTEYTTHTCRQDGERVFNFHSVLSFNEPNWVSYLFWHSPVFSRVTS